MTSGERLTISGERDSNSGNEIRKKSHVTSRASYKSTSFTFTFFVNLFATSTTKPRDFGENLASETAQILEFYCKN